MGDLYLHPMSELLPPINDLIYTRLDLPQPPEIDREKLTDWIRGNNAHALTQSQSLYEEKTDKSYPWIAANIVQQGEFAPFFVESFPEIVDYLKHFPTTKWRSIVVLSQRQNRECFLHTDPDLGMGIGWRVYLSHRGPRLYIQKFKERLAERPQTWASGGPQAIEELCVPERIYVNDSGRFAWALTSIRAAHAVEQNPEELGSRSVLLLIPEPSCVDYEATEQMLRRSAEKFSDTAIWF